MGNTKEMVLPTPQALTLTSIVIGLATTALILSFAIMIYRHYKTVDASEVRRLKG
jgi:multicomponent Na+:H+ antiporter subunit C